MLFKFRRNMDNFCGSRIIITRTVNSWYESLGLGIGIWLRIVDLGLELIAMFEMYVCIRYEWMYANAWFDIGSLRGVLKCMIDLEILDIWPLLYVWIMVPAFHDSDKFCRGAGPQYGLPMVRDTGVREW